MPVMLPHELRRTITPEEVNALPVRRYEGPVAVVDTPALLEAAWEDLRGEPAVGWDTETRPSFRKGEWYPPALLQAAGARAVYLIRLQRVECAEIVRSLFGAPDVLKAGISVADDLRQLERLYGEMRAEGVVDLGRVARAHGLRQTGLRNLCALLLGFRVPKGTKTTNWAAQRLTQQQIGYAATDAWCCRELYRKFKELKLL